MLPSGPNSLSHIHNDNVASTQNDSISNSSSSLSVIQTAQAPASSISRPSTPIHNPSTWDAFATPPPSSVKVSANLFAIFENKLGLNKANTIANFLEEQTEGVVIGGSMAILIHASRLDKNLLSNYVSRCRTPNDLDLIFTESAKQQFMSKKYNAQGIGQGQYHVTHFSKGENESAFKIDLIDYNKLLEVSSGNNYPSKDIEYIWINNKTYIITLEYLLHSKECALRFTERHKICYEDSLMQDMRNDITFIEEMIHASAAKAWNAGDQSYK